MKLGVVFPQTEITADVGAITAYAQAAEAAGYDHLLVYDHVLGAGLANRPEFRGPYNSETLFHEPFVLFGYLAGITQRLELAVGVIILPQRQTALVAKQAAEVDVLTGGRLRLGVGVGWNDVEYIGLGENFHNRGRRFEEQIEVLRLLWSVPVVDFTGRYHRIPEAGINPLPVQRPIPLWIGGTAEVVMARIGRLADGWFPQVQPGPRLDHDLALIGEHASAAGRDPGRIEMEGRITLAPNDEEQWRAQTDAWRAVGATHLSVNTMSSDRSPQQHIETIEHYMEVVR